MIEPKEHDQKNGKSRGLGDFEKRQERKSQRPTKTKSRWAARAAKTALAN
jgi:hypothetical protein